MIVCLYSRSPVNPDLRSSLQTNAIHTVFPPTAFLTISANEIRWPKLISILHRLNDYYKDVNVEDLTRSMRSTLVKEDPVTCCVYFNRLVDVIMRILKSKYHHNPFAQYRVADYFLRIEFQHRGSPHAQIILWLDNDTE